MSSYKEFLFTLLIFSGFLISGRDNLIKPLSNVLFIYLFLILMDTYFFKQITEEIESKWTFVSFITYHNGYFTFNILYTFSEIR